MASISGIRPDDENIKLKSQVKEPNQSLDKNAFMQLLMTQLQYQDPLNPMDNQEMMAQMAQFTALEQMNNVANMTEKQLAHGLVGKFVEYRYKNPETNQLEQLLGKVDYIKMQGGNTYIGIGDHEVKMGDISQVVDSSNIQANTSPFDLIGKTVQAIVERKDVVEGTDKPTAKKENVIIEGEVIGVRMKDEEPYVVIGTGKHQIEVEFKKVQTVVEKPSITGKQVSATIKGEDGKEMKIEGIAEYVAVLKDTQYVYVAGQFVPLDKIDFITKA